MEKLNLTFLLVIILLLLGIIGYWSVSTIQSGSEHKLSQKITELAEENKSLKEEVDDLEDELSLAKAKIEKLEPKEKEAAGEEVSEAPPEMETGSSKYQSLIDELKKLVNDNVFMKMGSRGTRVGSVQKFLNIYNNTSNKVDNDYGQSTKTAVTAFQKAQRLSADGEAGPGTFNKMIEWLEKKS